MSDKLDLPGSGYDVISKILHAYALCGSSPVSLGEVASKAGMNQTCYRRLDSPPLSPIKNAPWWVKKEG